jgi:uncharacterized membrane protein
LWSAPYFDAPIFWWTGLSTLTPSSNDFRPLLPWAGFVFFGMGLGHLLVRHCERSEAIQASQEPRAIERALAFSGRHSLAFYLIHQPLLFGAFTLVSLVITPPPDEKAFLRSCAVKCINQGVEAALCENACACVVTRVQKQGFWLEMARDRLTPQQKSEAHDIAVACYADASKP